MRKSITDRLKTSLESERESVQNKVVNNMNERFTRADNAFDNHIKPKVEKVNVVRDTFTLPENDYELIERCKTKLLENKISATKSEIIRAGLIILSKLSDNELVKSVELVEKVKTGRPKVN
jgi:hypothetical protein